MTDDERLLRILVWQNGLMRGILATTYAILLTGDSDAMSDLATKIEQVMKAPLPTFLTGETATIQK